MLEHKAAFEAYVHNGEATGLRALEGKAISAIRSIAGVRTISSNVYKKPFMTAGPAVGWVGETDTRTRDHLADAR